MLRDDPPPTEDELAAARATRDALWRTVRDAGAAGFEEAMGLADRMADHVRRDAQKANERRRLELNIDKRELELFGLAEDGKALDTRAEELDALQARAAQHVARFREVLRDPEDALPGTGPEKVLAELPDLLEIAEQRLAQQQRVIQEHAAHEERVALERTEVTDAAADVAQQERALADWEDEWRQALLQAGLPADRDTVGALSDLELLEQAAVKVAEATRTNRESEQATARVEQFHALLRTTATACGRAVPEDEAERYLLVDRLHADAKLHLATADKRDSLGAEQDRLRVDADSLRTAVERAEQELTELIARSSTADLEMLRAAVRRREEHTQLAKSFDDVRETLVMSGESLEDLRGRT